MMGISVQCAKCSETFVIREYTISDEEKGPPPLPTQDQPQLTEAHWSRLTMEEGREHAQKIADHVLKLMATSDMKYSLNPQKKQQIDEIFRIYGLRKPMLMSAHKYIARAFEKVPGVFAYFMNLSIVVTPNRLYGQELPVLTFDVWKGNGAYLGWMPPEGISFSTNEYSNMIAVFFVSSPDFDKMQNLFEPRRTNAMEQILTRHWTRS